MMKGNIAGLMKQAQQMQENMKRAQAELEALEVIGQAAGGSVKVTMTGKHALKRVEIADGAMDDKEMLEDYLVNVLNKAIEKATTVHETGVRLVVLYQA